jgi:hypothetical protein
MPTTVYRGSDGTISVATEAGPEGDKAKAINEQFSLTPIGRVTGVTVCVTNEVEPFHELGQRIATDLRPGNINVYGTIDRAYINGALMKLMLGDAADARPAGTFVTPSFNLSIRLENPSVPGISSTVTVMGVKLSEWNYDLPEDDFALERVAFRALWVKVDDKSGT